MTLLKKKIIFIGSFRKNINCESFSNRNLVFANNFYTVCQHVKFLMLNKFINKVNIFFKNITSFFLDNITLFFEIYNFFFKQYLLNFMFFFNIFQRTSVKHFKKFNSIKKFKRKLFNKENSLYLKQFFKNM